MALFGCIADDFTGASDMASFLQQGGLRTVLYNGVPKSTEENGEAVVIALKTRTMAQDQAVNLSLQALNRLREMGVKQVYIKYCSTFDSTPRGNIGPVCDAVMEAMGAKFSVICPALPVNGRTVKNGNLLVNGVPLHESSMKDHPLTPMWDCRLKELMEAQSHYKAYPIGKVTPGGNPPWQTIDPREPFYLIPDHTDEEDGRAIAQVFGREPLLTGGSGLAPYLAQRLREESGIPKETFAGVDGPALLLAGSCSVATRNQVKNFILSGGRAVRLDPLRLLSGDQNLSQLRETLDSAFPAPVLFYSSDEPQTVEKIKKAAGDKAAAVLEKTMAQLAEYGIQKGARRVIVAGGETSGAVMEKLGRNRFLIGESIAPGVPMMAPVDAPDLRFVLKSGNFGDEQFFSRALAITGPDKKEEA